MRFKNQKVHNAVAVVLAWLIVVVPAYALGAFVAWDPNPADWHVSLRLVLGAVSTIWAVALIAGEKR